MQWLCQEGERWGRSILLLYRLYTAHRVVTCTLIVSWVDRFMCLVHCVHVATNSGNTHCIALRCAFYCMDLQCCWSPCSVPSQWHVTPIIVFCISHWTHVCRVVRWSHSILRTGRRHRQVYLGCRIPEHMNTKQWPHVDKFRCLRVDFGRPKRLSVDDPHTMMLQSNKTETNIEVSSQAMIYMPHVAVKFVFQDE